MGDGTDPDPPISSGGGDSSDGDQEDDGTRPTGLDDHTSDGETGEVDDTSSSDSGSGAAAAGAAAGGAASGAAGAGAAGGAGAGGTPTSTPEEPSGEESDDEVESEPEIPAQPETPEENSPEKEPEQPDHLEPEEPERPDDHGQEDEYDDDEEEQEDDDEEEQEDEDDDEDDDDEEDQVAHIVVHSDAWDSIAWGIYPIRLQLKEEYGEQVQFDDRLAPVREFDSPEDRAQHWEKWEPRHGMPVNTEVWNEDPPESTKLANRAFAAARQQSIPLAKRFMRRLRTAAIIEGMNIEDRETLLKLAQNVGLDTDQLEEDWEGVDLRQSSRGVETPKTTIHVDGETVTQPGLVTANDVKTLLKRAGLEAADPQPLPGFVERHGPVAVKEIQQVYEYSREEVLDELQNVEEVVPVEYGETTLWRTSQSV
ncbi:DsbA family protein [Halorientalis marina]|uniref:DsbA family protein n=1 Tax=Halorientalis marina TaxID=2931976 RepID=UPI001FF10489|nr:DsbA family protein [Halorientalis marina]